MTDNKIPRSSGNLNIFTADQFTEAFTAPGLTDAAVGCAFMIDNMQATSGVWTLTLQEDATAAFGGAESDVATGTFDFGAGGSIATDQFAYIALSSPYTFTTLTAGAYRWKMRSAGGSSDRLRQSSTSTSRWCFICFDDRTATISANDTIFVVDAATKIDSNITLGNGVTGVVGWKWTHALYILTGGDLDFDDGGSYTLTLEGSVIISGGGQLGSGTALSSSVSGTIEWDMGSYSNGNFYLYVIRGGRVNLKGTTAVVSAKYASGAGTTGDPLLIATDQSLSVNDYIVVTATNGTEETERKYIKSGSHGAGWVLADTAGGAESGFSNTHTTDAYVLLLTRNVKIQTNSSTKGVHYYDYKRNTDTHATNDGDNSIMQYVQTTYMFDFYPSNYQWTGVVIDDPTANTYGLQPVTAVPSTHIDNIYIGGQVLTGNSDYMHDLLNADGQTERGSFYVNILNNCVKMNSAGNVWDTCRFLDNNTDGDSSAAALKAQTNPGINSRFVECEFEGNQQAHFLIDQHQVGLRFEKCSFGQVIPAPLTVNIRTYDASYWDIVFENCKLGDTNFCTECAEGLVGSSIKVHKYDQDDNKHFVYQTYGTHQSSGATLDDTTTRTVGALAYRFAPTDVTTGIYWEFDVPAPANSAVGVIGFARENTAFEGDASSVLKMELFLPGSTTADDTVTFAPSAANAWGVWSLTANYTESVSALAKVRITAKTATASAYAYIADIWNGTNEITNLNTWKDALPSPVQMQDFANPASVWSVLTSGNTTAGTFGEKGNLIQPFVLYG